MPKTRNIVLNENSDEKRILNSVQHVTVLMRVVQYLKNNLNPYSLMGQQDLRDLAATNHQDIVCGLEEAGIPFPKESAQALVAKCKEYLASQDRYEEALAVMNLLKKS